MILIFITLGRIRKLYNKIFESDPGTTLVFLPSAVSIGAPILSGKIALPMFMLALCPNLLSTGPGAAASTSTLKGFSSCASASAND
jgi:hypothetical protein